MHSLTDDTSQLFLPKQFIKQFVIPTFNDIFTCIPVFSILDKGKVTAFVQGART
ncbi:hypothetical protein C8R41DRAFT_452639 [Lentinula lateritia]|uniref:Uncharacterized protein n=1 Tax=Lentinula lateritia TaxID=40482 RepID=A0ABQ8VAN9_9AGAR|nr:hypothetical protein C8R41DRAFT_452639 [Lentinula lateritia]